jgi:uncharacterized membrane protein YfcA
VDFRASVVGLLVGILVGVTGMGGGAIMTPVLITFGWASVSNLIRAHNVQ